MKNILLIVLLFTLNACSNKCKTEPIVEQNENLIIPNDFKKI